MLAASHRTKPGARWRRCVWLAVYLYCLFCVLSRVCHFYRTVSFLLVYDCLCVPQIRDSVVDLPIQDFYDWMKPPPPVLASVPPYLWRPPVRLPRNSRCRRRGRRAGVICWPRAHLALSSTFNSRRTLFDLSRGCAVYDIRGSADYFYWWLLPILSETGLPLPCCHPVRIHRRGCAPENLRSVSRAPAQTVRRMVRMALISARSVANDTFILNDF